MLLVALTIVGYTLRTRALHRHRHYLDMWEWVFWSGLITFFLLIIGAIFRFDFAVILIIMISGFGDDGLGAVPQVPAAVRGVRAPGGPPALSRPRAPVVDPRQRSARREPRRRGKKR